MSPRPPPPRVSPIANPQIATARALMAAGRFAEAIAPLAQALRLAPRDAEIHHNLGLACLAARRPADAATALKNVVVLTPTFPDAHLRLGQALEQLRDVEGALAAYSAAVRLKPSLTEAHFRLAALLDDEGRGPEAAAHFRRAQATARKTPRLQRLAEVRALMSVGRVTEARTVLTRATAAHPTEGFLLDLMGTILADAGEFDAAAGFYERALATGPEHTGCYYDLVRCRRYTADDPIIGAMLSVRDRPVSDGTAQMKLHLALGKVYDDIGEYEAAMRAFDAAYAVRSSLLRFNLVEFEALVDRTITHFTPELIGQAAAFGRQERTPILIVGMPRSGTTLVEQIVSSHADVAGGGELDFWPKRASDAASAEADWPTRDFIAEAGADYLRLLGEIGPSAARVTDKRPTNFLNLGLIHLAFPNAVIIHCRRSPIDTALSIHQTAFLPNAWIPTGGPELVRYYRAYERVMAHWRSVLPAGRMLEIDYDAVTADPATHIRRMIAFTGLDWDPACLNPERNGRSVNTPSKWQVKQPINTGSTGRWRRYEPYLGPLAELVER